MAMTTQAGIAAEPATADPEIPGTASEAQSEPRAQLQQRSAEIQGENSALQRRIAELERENAALDARRAEQDAKLADLLARLDELETARDD